METASPPGELRTEPWLVETLGGPPGSLFTLPFPAGQVPAGNAVPARASGGEPTHGQR